MKIVFAMSGGSLDNVIIDGELEVPNDCSDTASQFYSTTLHGEIGRQFIVRNGKDFDEYEVVRRWENGGTVIVRAMCVGGYSGTSKRAGDVNELLVIPCESDFVRIKRD
jgi:hypothetical protein